MEWQAVVINRILFSYAMANTSILSRKKLKSQHIVCFIKYFRKPRKLKDPSLVEVLVQFWFTRCLALI